MTLRFTDLRPVILLGVLVFAGAPATNIRAQEPPSARELTDEVQGALAAMSGRVDTLGGDQATLRAEQRESLARIEALVSALEERLADRIRAAKAEAIRHSDATHPKIRMGVAAIGSQGNQSELVREVSFGHTFDRVPVVVANARTEAGRSYNDTFSVTVKSISTTSFTVIICRTGGNRCFGWGQNLQLDWVAVERGN